MDKEMIFKIITLLLTSSVISAFIGSRTSLKQNDKNNALKYVTSERLSWGKNIRDLTTKFFSEPLERKVTLKTLEVNLNPYDIYDVNTLLLGEAIVNNKNYIYLINEKLFNKFFIRYSSKIFKKKSKEFYVDCFLRNKSYKEMVELNNLEHELSVLQGATTPNKERIKNLKKQIKKLKKRNKKVKKYLKKVTKKSFKNKSTLWVKVEKENFEEEF